MAEETDKKGNGEEFYFPHEQIRQEQDRMLRDVDEALSKKKCMIIHAPTGLGKTTVLGPAIAHAKKNNLTVVFLTARHTQHKIAIETLRKIKEKFKLSITVADIIGKKWMCSIQGARNMQSGDFSEYCKHLCKNSECEYYENTKNKTKTSMEAELTLDEIRKKNTLNAEEVMKICSKERLCSYEISLLLAAEANAIISDYFYIFNPSIRNHFFKKIDKQIENCIIIIDEGHNLAERLRELMSVNISSFSLGAAKHEAIEFGYEQELEYLNHLTKALDEISAGLELGKECLAEKSDFIELVEKNCSEKYGTITTALASCGEEVLKLKQKSRIMSIARFLELWPGSDQGFTRILKNELKQRRGSQKKEKFLSLSYKCLDPAALSQPVISNSYSTIAMSATMLPADMHLSVLGFPSDTFLGMYKSPFLETNRLNLIVPETTTKYTKRNSAEYEKIAKICADITNIVLGNSLLLFPSYYIKNEVGMTFERLSEKTVFYEQSELTKEEKEELLDRFKKYKGMGASLLAVARGSFAEGIDLPGVLKCVIVIGLPLQPPDIETQEMIRHYDKKFGKGMEFGYIFPAMNKVIQGAGRCIRSEKDKGVMIFLDERFLLNCYRKCFPGDWKIVVAKEPVGMVREFFEERHTTA